MSFRMSQSMLACLANRMSQECNTAVSLICSLTGGKVPMSKEFKSKFGGKVPILQRLMPDFVQTTARKPQSEQGFS